MERREDKREKTCVHARGGIYRDTEDNVVVILESVETTRNQGPPFFCRPTSGNIQTSSERERERKRERERERERIGFSRVRGGIVWNPWRKISLDKERFDSLDRARDYSSPLSGAYGAHRDYNIRELPREYCFDRCLSLSLSLFFSFYPQSS